MNIRVGSDALMSQDDVRGPYQVTQYEGYTELSPLCAICESKDDVKWVCMTCYTSLCDDCIKTFEYRVYVHRIYRSNKRIYSCAVCHSTMEEVPEGHVITML